MAGKRTHLASIAGGKVESTPGSSKPTLVHLAPDQVAPTPLNPRQDFNPAELKELGNSMATGQLQPCVGIARARYVKLFPEHEDQLPDCRIVMAAGERRWKAALEAGLPHLDVHIREDIAESRVRFLAAVLTENVERSNFNFIEEARGLKLMLEMSDGNQTKAAEGLQKSKQWFSQRIGLLRLSEEMQALVVSGELKAFREMRMYSAMPPAEQFAAWKADREEAERLKASKSARANTTTEGPTPTKRSPKQAETYTAVYAEADHEQPPAPPEAEAVRAVAPRPVAGPPTGALAEEDRSGPDQAALPEPRRSAPVEPQPTSAQEEPASDRPGTDWPLPSDWKVLIREVMTQYPEFDRHMLTKGLSKVMEDELGATAGSGSAESTSA